MCGVALRSCPHAYATVRPWRRWVPRVFLLLACHRFIPYSSQVSYLRLSLATVVAQLGLSQYSFHPLELAARKKVPENRGVMGFCGTFRYAQIINFSSILFLIPILEYSGTSYPFLVLEYKYDTVSEHCISTILRILCHSPYYMIQVREIMWFWLVKERTTPDMSLGEIRRRRSPGPGAAS